MNIQENLAQVEKILSPYSLKVDYPAIQPEVINVVIDRDDLKRAVQSIVDAGWGYLIAITAYDTKAEDGTPQIGLIYHLGGTGTICALRVFLTHEDRVVSSICQVVPSATLYERELIELFGIDIPDTPNKERLVLPDEWPEGVYPLMKDFKGYQDDPDWKAKVKP